MPICITGMHRSGTSMVSRLLNLCGLFLGEGDDLVSPNRYNKMGYWESKHFVNLNNDIFFELGGSWDFPTSVINGWERKRDFIPIKNMAIDVIRGFSNHVFWGWKDPRNCLTIPFWTSIIPDLKFVICLRNPIEVAKSLQNYGMTFEFGMHLWFYYNKRLMVTTKPEQRIITHYNSYFLNPHKELERILEFLKHSIPAGNIEHACNSILGALRHYKTMETGNSRGSFPSGLIELYEEMIESAEGNHQQKLVDNQKTIAFGDYCIIEKDKINMHAKIGDTVRFHLVCKLNDGTLYDTSVNSEPIQLKIGSNQIMPVVEQVIIGMREGEIKTVKIAGNKYFGLHHSLTKEELILDIQLGKIL